MTLFFLAALALPAVAQDAPSPDATSPDATSPDATTDAPRALPRSDDDAVDAQAGLGGEEVARPGWRGHRRPEW